MRVRYTGSYPGVLEGHRRWSPGEERDVSDEVAAQLTRGNGAFWTAVQDMPVEDATVVATTVDESAHKRRRGAQQES